MAQILLPDCQELIQQSQQAKSVEELHAICTKACHIFGFDQFLYGGRIPTSFVRPQLIIISGYSQEWWDHYNEQDYFKNDPVLEYCTQNILPLEWHNMPEQQLSKKLSSKIMNECADFGLKAGVSFPVHTPTGEFAMLSFTSDKNPTSISPDIQYALPHLMILTHYIHEAVMRIFRNQHNSKGAIELTQREKECLLWAAEGKTSDETANILHISESTVRFHLNNAARKLNVHNRRHAIARAICLGLIKPII